MPSDIEEFLSKYSPEVLQLADQLRTYVREAAPGCTETLHSGWKVISYGHRKKFCAIAPHATWVNLQFHAGASLADDQGLLTGSGKSMRHVKISTASEIDANLAALIQQASAFSR